jgi:hypothetical protein
MRHLAIAVLALAACTQSIAEDAFSVCRPLCRCTESPLPGEQDSCTAGCMMQFARNPLGDACIACVVEHATRCTTLLEDCTPVCTQPEPLESYAEGPAPQDRDGPRIEDG